MEIVNERGVSGAVKFLLDRIIAVGAIAVVGLPFGLAWGFEHTTWTAGENYCFLLFFLCGTGVLGIGMVFELRQIFRRVNEHNPFQRKNAASLKRIAILALGISVAYMIKTVFYISFLTIIVAMAFLVFGLAGLVFSELFRQAVEVKEENDLTI